jgi:signal transduction histidine kinase
MLDEESLRLGSALRERRRVILLCAPLTLLFSIADTLALHGFSWKVFAVRVLWAAQLAAGGLLLGRMSQRRERIMLTLLGAGAGAFFCIITWMTGGYGSPLFHWVLAMPLLAAVVLQEYPKATLAASISSVAGGVAILLGSGEGVPMAVQWALLASGLSAMAVYAAVAYRRLRFREQALREAAAVASERARASEEALQARDEFLSVASHELRTPLTSLKLQADRALRRPPDPALARGPGREAIEGIQRQIERLNSVVDTMLDATMLSDTRPTLHRGDRDLAPLVREVCERLRPVAQGQGCALEVHADQPLVANVDGTRFEQVLTNLLSNAFKFGHGRPVKVTLGRSAGWACLAIRDGGIGIAPEDQRRIFERFQRATSSRNYGGLGLGLWVSRRLIEEMQGTVAVDSHLGEGATFTVEIPLSDPEQLAARDAARDRV